MTGAHATENHEKERVLTCVDSAFHPSEVDKMSTRNFGELSGKK